MPVDPTAARPISIADNDFDLKQHDFLRQEIQAAEAAARANERYAIVALAALWAWTAKEAPSIGVVSSVLSMLIGLLGGLRMWALWINMHTKAGYVAQIERLLARPALGGWEHYFRDATAGRDTIPVAAHVETETARAWHDRPGAIGYTSAVFWILVIVGSPFLGCYVSQHLSPSSTKPIIEVRCASTR